ncbi:MAG: lysophospholipid acyltransferase family protein [Wenzhouxiangellaceae bacterium]|nr:lysophospholipid acyltransferase family protein [Wenzhouxiangellaceae bacterium]
MKRRLRRLRRGLGSALLTGLARRAGRRGPEALRRRGERLGLAHYWLTWPFRGRLRRDISTVLGVSRSEAAAILRDAHRVNDRGVFEVLAAGDPHFAADALVEEVEVRDLHRLEQRPDQTGAVLLGMHMGNGIFLAAKLARLGLPVRLVYRDPRRLGGDTLGACLRNLGIEPLELDRENPTRSFREMLGVLKSGGLLQVLMDQGSKREGVDRRFLGKTLRMPTGIARLAGRAGAPIYPVHCEADRPNWTFRVHAPLEAEDDDERLDVMVASMTDAIRARPGLWAWHHRRWKRYDLDRDTTPGS